MNHTEKDIAEIFERCAQIAADAAEGSRMLHNAAAKERDRDGCNIHAEGWRTGLQIAASIRALISTPDMPIGGEQ